MPHDLLGHIADHEALDAGSAMRCQDDKIGPKVLRALEDRFKRIAAAHMIANPGIVANRVAAKLLEQDFGVLLGSAQYICVSLRFVCIHLHERGVGLGNRRQIDLIEGIMDYMENIERGVARFSDFERQPQSLRRRMSKDPLGKEFF